LHKTLKLGRTFALACLFACTLGIDTARADQAESQRAVARELGTLGMQAYFDKDYVNAADHLDKAYRLFSTPTLGLWSARALIQIGQWVRAAERLRETQLASAAVGDNAAQMQAQADAKTELQGLEPRIPRLSLAIEGAAASQVTLSIDERPVAHELFDVARPVDPGEHRVVGVFEAQHVEVTVNAQPNETQVARVVFQPKPLPSPTPEISIKPGPKPEPVPEPAPNYLRPAAIASFALAGASLVTSLVVTMMASHTLDDCNKRTGEYFCSDQQADAYETRRNLATATFYTGAALAGAGLALWLLQPSAADKPRQLNASASPLGAELSVKF
jgi:hypothetical protein